jgi:Ser/Thr protein kinase RdoA (MazF antagonist)
VYAEIDLDPLRSFIAAYQTVAPLKLGELWAIPIMLRLGLIENLQRLEAHLLHERDSTVGHIRHIKALRHEREAIIRGELEALRAALVPTQANTPPPIPDLEERFAAPRYLRAAE